MNVQELIQEILEKEILVQAIFSSPLVKSDISRVGVRPIQGKKGRLYQISEQMGPKVVHRNISEQESLGIFSKYLLQFKQTLFQTTEGDYQLLTNRKGVTTVISKSASRRKIQLIHNREKNYLLPQEAPFLFELGLANAQGKIFPQKMDKFRQINRFLEMVSDTLHVFNPKEKLQIVDFGCGKAYLTFALYYLLREIRGFDVEMTGLDLKTDVIAYCQQLAEKCGYISLHFVVGDIAVYQPALKIDMVVALHACDTATDAALAQAVRWKAKVILAAPCCQHELYGQLASKPLEALLHYGILRERLASLVTDAARAQLLEMQGYSTQILEFIDSEHTPKNLLIRAILGNSEEKRGEASQRYENLKKALLINPALERYQIQ
ncbi:MAG: SAM-dependent methyltransferase [Parachlamydia sp.]|nr:SAM-dependent methyltransferase [Parachlamydia sp.]